MGEFRIEMAFLGSKRINYMEQKCKFSISAKEKAFEIPLPRFQEERFSNQNALRIPVTYGAVLNDTQWFLVIFKFAFCG